MTTSSLISQPYFLSAKWNSCGYIALSRFTNMDFAFVFDPSNIDWSTISLITAPKGSIRNLSIDSRYPFRLWRYSI